MEGFVPIEGCSNYLVNEKGEVYSVKSNIIMKPKKLDKQGHLGYGIIDDNGKPKYFYLHRLIAQYFIPNPEGFPIVRHLNDCKTDNRIENLAWGTQHDNGLDAVRNGKTHIPTPEETRYANRNQIVPVKIVETGEVFESQQECAKAIGGDQRNIFACLHGKRHTCMGYHFDFAEKEEIMYEY